jgi:dUTP pyrophosphatase
MSYVLYICPGSAESAKAYEAVASAYMRKPFGERDAGFDLICPETKTMTGISNKLPQGVSAAVYDMERNVFRAYWLLPRSSISKTPMRLANSVGLIDSGYRGIVTAVVDALGKDHTVAAGDRYFQLAAPDLMPFSSIQIVSEIPGGPTQRGTGGFGSTGVDVSYFS